MIDLQKLKFDNTTRGYINPREIFDALPKNKYGYLRSVQQEVLDEWFKNKDREYNIIKMNTGSGKTIVALIILTSLMNDNGGNSIYIVPDNYLVEQVCNQAYDLGIKVTKEYNDLSFLQKKSILVTTIKTLVNGKSVFGMRGNNNKTIDNIVIDDVHSCLSTIEEQSIVTIPNTCSAYNDIYNLIKNDLCSYKKCTPEFLEDEIFSGITTIVPFWIWNKKIPLIKECLKNYSNEDFYTFNYQLVKDNLNFCRCFFRNDHIEIIPYCTPINKIKSFIKAKHKIFLSATLPNDTIFSTILNMPEHKLNNIIIPSSASDIGERMILFPQLINPLIKDEDIFNEVKKISTQINVIVIVPSKNRAKIWEPYSDTIISSDNLQIGIEKIKQNKNGLYVIINKYDGIDLPDDSCRLIILDRLPGLHNGLDSFEKSCLPNSNRINSEYLQKLEQGMGRGIRSNSDYCGILLMGGSLIDLIFNNNGIDYFSNATKKQIQLSMNLWEQMKNQSLQEIVENFNYLIDRDQEWVAMSRDVLVNCKYSSLANIDILQLQIRKAYNEAIQGNIEKAISILEEYKNSLNNKEEIGFVKMLMAEYMDNLDCSKSQELLLSAYRDNQYILKPIDGINYLKINKLNTQTNNILKIIENFNGDLNKYIIKINSLIDNLIFAPDTHEQFEESLKELFYFIGYSSQRPEKQFNEGPDNLIQLETTYLVIECKNETIANEICKSDSAQLNESISWFKRKYGENLKVVPVMIHNSNIFSKQSAPSSNTKIITPQLLESLKTNIKNFLISISSNSQNLNKILQGSKINENGIISILGEYSINN